MSDTLEMKFLNFCFQERCETLMRGSQDCNVAATWLLDNGSDRWEEDGREWDIDIAHGERLLAQVLIQRVCSIMCLCGRDHEK